MPQMRMASGIIQTSVFQLAHGGAGPQDPKDRDAQRANEFIAEILNMNETNGELELPHTVQEYCLNLNLAEKLGLFVIRQLEEHPSFNAGHGASLQADGQARLSASFMESTRRVFSAVINATEIVHPIDLALILQRETHTVLDSFGAKNLIQKFHLPQSSPVTKDRFRKWIFHQREQLAGMKSHGYFSTVGCLTIDDSGNLSAMTSTGGVGNETPGRIGDSPTIAGNFCSENVAVSCTGMGEQIISDAVAPSIALYLNSNETLEERIRKVFQNAAEKDRRYSAIAVRRLPDKKIEWAAASVNCTLCYGMRGRDQMAKAVPPL